MKTTYIKHYNQNNYSVAMFRATFGFAKTHKVLTLSVPCKEADGKYPVRIREVRVPNAQAEKLYQKGIAWVDRKAQ